MAAFTRNILIFGMVLIMVPLWAQNAHEETLTEGNLKVTLSLDKDSIVVGEPVHLGILLENSGNAPAEIVSRFHLPEGNDIKVMVQPPRELEFHYEGPLDRGSFPVNAILMMPGKPVQWSTTLLSLPQATSGLLFDQPGRYSLDVTFAFSISGGDSRLVAELNNAVINVRAPAGKEMEAVKLLGTPATARAMHLGIIRDESARKALKEIADNYADTVYGPPAMKAYGLATTYSENPDYKEALGYLTKYLKSHQDVPGADWVAYSIAAGYHFEKNYKAARETIFYLKERYKDTVYIVQQDPLCQYYIYKPSENSTKVPWIAAANRFVAPGTVPPTDLKPVPQ